MLIIIKINKNLISGKILINPQRTMVMTITIVTNIVKFVKQKVTQQENVCSTQRTQREYTTNIIKRIKNYTTTTIKENLINLWDT